MCADKKILYAAAGTNSGAPEDQPGAGGNEQVSGNSPRPIEVEYPHHDGNVEMEAQNDDSRDIHRTAQHGHGTEHGNLNTSKPTYVFFIFFIKMFSVILKVSIFFYLDIFPFLFFACSTPSFTWGHLQC